MKKASRKQWAAAAAGVVLALSCSISALAGDWTYNDAKGAWSYVTDNGRQAVNEWLLIDTDLDGFGEWYYFWADGYNYPDIVTPDGYTLNNMGAWVVDGVLQLEPVGVNTRLSGINDGSSGSGNAYNLADNAMVPYVGRFTDTTGREIIFYPNGYGGLAAETYYGSEDGWNWRYPEIQWDELEGCVHEDFYHDGSLMEYTIYLLAGDQLQVITYAPQYGRVGSWVDGTYYRQ